MKFNIFIFIIFSFKCERINYTNPVIKDESPDPSVIKAHDNYYYLFTTNEKIYRSRDLVNWEYLRKAFDDKSRPSFIENVDNYWNPCITKQDNLYILYFSLSNGDNNGIGVATSSNPGGPFDIMNTNGKLFLNNEIEVDKSINPHFIEEAGKKYIIFGNQKGIYGIELNQDGITIKNLTDKFQLAGNNFELPYIYKRNNYYYLFASIGDCCTNSNPDQKIIVGRATSFKGTYMSKSNKSMINNDYDVIVGGNEEYSSVGSISIINDTEKTWIIFHARKGDGERFTCIDELKWDSENWPYLENDSPSFYSTEGPIILTDTNVTFDNNDNDSIKYFDNNNSDTEEKITSAFHSQNNDEYSTESIILNTSYIIPHNNTNFSLFNFFMGNSLLDDNKNINITEEILNGGLSLLIPKIYNESFIITEKDKEYQLSTVSNQYKRNDWVIIDLGDCEQILKDKYGINKDEDLLIFKIENHYDGINIPIIEYEIYSIDGTKKLDLNECNNTFVYNIPVNISEDELYKHDPESDYYNDRCNKYTSENKLDMTLYDRKNEFNEKNFSLCEVNCTFKGYNINTSTVQCECIQNQGLDRLNNEKNDLVIKMESSKSSSNIDVVQCSDVFNNSEELSTNPGFLSLIIILVIFFIVFIIFFIKGYNLLKQNMNDVIDKMFKNDEKEKNKKNKIFNDNITKHPDTKLKLIKQSKNKRSKRDKLIKNNDTELKNSNLMLLNKNGKQSKEIITTSVSYKRNTEKKNEKFLYETDYELNNSEYKSALKYDKRSCCEYYYSLLKSKQIFIFTFLNFDDYNSGIIKKFIFFLSFALHYTINALFFNDSNMHQILIDEGSYNINYQFPHIILSSIASIIILRIMLITLILTDKYILEIKLQKSIENAKNLLKANLKCLLIKYIIFFGLNLVLLILFWYYLTCWNAIYENTQIYLLKNTFISFGVSLVYPFIINIIPVILRIQALENHENKCLYKASKIFQIL